MEADEKKCPACAEVIKADAKVCKHCGLNLTTGRMVNAPPVEEKKKLSVGKGCLIIIAVVVGLSVLGSILGGNHGGGTVSPATSDNNGSEASEAAAVAPVEVSAVEVEAAYAANEAAAQQKYGNQALRVSGRIKSIDLDFSDKPFVVLQGTNEFTGPQLHLTEDAQAKASSLSKGQKIVAVCQNVSEVVGTPMFKDCTI